MLCYERRSDNAQNNNNKGTKSGQCRVYELGLTGGDGTTGWIKLGEYIDGSSGDNCGYSVS